MITTESMKLDCPPSLRLLAPETVMVQDSKGRRAHISSGGFLLVANRRYQIRVLLAEGSVGGKGEHFSLVPDEIVRPIGSPQEVRRADGRIEFLLTFKTSRLVRPIPVQTHITIVLKHPHWGDYCHEVSVVVWPTMMNRILWALSAVAAPVVPRYLAEASLIDGHFRPLSEILERIRDPWEVVLYTILSALAVGLGVYLVNWGYQVFLTSESA